MEIILMHTSIKDNHSNPLRELQMKLLSTTQLETSEKMIEAWPWQPNRPNPNDEMASDRIEWRQIKARKRLNHQLHRLQSAKIEAHEATFFFSLLFFPGISERDLWISAPTVEINWFESVGTGTISPAICDRQSTLDTNVIIVGSSWFNAAVESTEWQPINLPICYPIDHLLLVQSLWWLEAAFLMLHRWFDVGQLQVKVQTNGFIRRWVPIGRSHWRPTRSSHHNLFHSMLKYKFVFRLNFFPTFWQPVHVHSQTK